MTRSRHRLRALWGLVASVARRAFTHGSTGQASQFAYNAFIATVPFLFVVVASISKAAGPDAYERTSAEFDRVVPEELRGLLLRSLQIAERNAGSATALLVIAVPVALYVIGNAMSSLVDGIDDALGVPRRNWVRSKLVSIVLAAAASVFVLATTAALIGGAGLVSRVVGLLGGSGAARIGRIATYPISIASLITFTLILYRLAPSRRVLRLRESLPGAIAAVACWLGATRLFGLYTARFDTYELAYGSFGFVVIYLIFLWLSGLILILGAELNAARAERSRSAPQEGR